jgi:hypothetical protein
MHILHWLRIKFKLARFTRYRLGVVAHACKTSRLGGSQFEARKGKKLARPPSQQTSWVGWGTTAILAMREA